VSGGSGGSGRCSPGHNVIRQEFIIHGSGCCPLFVIGSTIATRPRENKCRIGGIEGIYILYYIQTLFLNKN
tara:strand:- start:348 stop:560 length:213 start_codon:yes stop_codon:yes gene_type:complete